MSPDMSMVSRESHKKVGEGKLTKEQINEYLNIKHMNKKHVRKQTINKQIAKET